MCIVVQKGELVDDDGVEMAVFVVVAQVRVGVEMEMRSRLGHKFDGLCLCMKWLWLSVFDCTLRRGE